jgi:hypothetical protein
LEEESAGNGAEFQSGLGADARELDEFFEEPEPLPVSEAEEIEAFFPDIRANPEHCLLCFFEIFPNVEGDEDAIAHASHVYRHFCGMELMDGSSQMGNHASGRIADRWGSWKKKYRSGFVAFLSIPILFFLYFRDHRFHWSTFFSIIDYCWISPLSSEVFFLRKSKNENFYNSINML